MSRRPSTLFLGGILVLVAVLAMLLPVGPAEEAVERSLLQQKRTLVRSLDLTDLCLFTEASYTRHLATIDLSTPFQDSPMTLEHFPSGALAPPPAIR
jgi:hypothetical protein